METIKAVFFDIDGTLYWHSIHDLPESAKIALHKLRHKDVKVAIATSRCKSELANLPSIFKTYPFDAMIIDGGACIYEKEQCIKHTPIAKEIVHTLLTYCKKHHLAMRYSTQNGNYFMDEVEQEVKDKFFSLYLNIPFVKAYQEEEVFNILIFTTNLSQQQEIQQLIGSQSIIRHNDILEICPKHINKSVAVAFICEHWGICPSQILCIGDGNNDVKFLEAAGHCVAMGNGCEEVKQVADYVTSNIEDDGILEALIHFQLIDIKPKKED